ncbi:MAG: glycosyltransferase [Candidatus ainarchaeum sp.]|nr:glycosyltransferase [Candidatus ainarchaeum sp.]
MTDKDLPFVSIIVPAWNEEAGIEDTIKSLKKIIYPREKFEIIVVDDGSSDNTYERAKKYENEYIRIFKKDENGGKYTALNFGIEKSRGTIIVSTDADNLEAEPDVLLKMTPYFQDKEVMCVAPSMAVSNPKGFLGRIQQVEYLMGVFLRKVFSALDAIHVTPGAFSAYRKKFIVETGGFRRAHLTEDMEMALRIQSKGYKIANSVDSVVYTKAPTKFIPLLKQRRRWYVGQTRNYIDYKGLFSRKYGALGTIVLPLSIWAIASSIIFSISVIIRGIGELYHKLILYKSINFEISSSFFGGGKLYDLLLEVLINPLFSFSIFFIILLMGYLFFARRFIKKHYKIRHGLILFLLVYSLLLCIWWIDALIYATIKYKKLKWR